MMPTIAQQRLYALAKWFERNSRWGITPNGDNLSVGQYAAIVPCSFAEAPPFGDQHHPDALPLYLSNEQSVGMLFADFVPEAPDTQPFSEGRLEHCLWLLQDAKLPPVALVALASADEPIAAAIDRAGLSGVDLATTAVLAVPTFMFSPGAQYRLKTRLPFIPRAHAPDPDMPTDPVFDFEKRTRDRW